MVGGLCPFLSPSLLLFWGWFYCDGLTNKTVFTNERCGFRGTAAYHDASLSLKQHVPYTMTCFVRYPDIEPVQFSVTVKAPASLKVREALRES